MRQSLAILPRVMRRVFRAGMVVKHDQPPQTIVSGYCNSGSRVTQSNARFKISSKRFGDHGAGTVFFELVDYHVVETGEPSRFVSGYLARLVDAPGVSHPRDHGID